MQRKITRQAWKPLVGGIAASVVLTGLFVSTTVEGYPRYNDGCPQCHGAFTDAESPIGTVFPGDSKHEMHRGSDAMNTECDLCHTSGDQRNPYLGSSNGTDNNLGVGCTGCHGRDYGGTIGNTAAGLRMLHFVSGVETCVGCHEDDPVPMPESVKPLYYGTPDTLANDPCNTGPDFLENWSIGDTEGNDNDGNGQFDGDDPDCAGGVPGDADGDGCVGFQDILVVLGAWGEMGGNGDVNGDGSVGFPDILVILGNWGLGCV